MRGTESSRALLRIAPRLDRLSIGANAAVATLSIGAYVTIVMAALLRQTGVVIACVTLPIAGALLVYRSRSIRLELLESGFYVANYFRRRAIPWGELRMVDVAAIMGNRNWTTLGALRFHATSGRIAARASVRMTPDEFSAVRDACLHHGVAWSVDARDLRITA